MRRREIRSYLVDAVSLIEGFSVQQDLREQQEVGSIRLVLTDEEPDRDGHFDQETGAGQLNISVMASIVSDDLGKLDDGIDDVRDGMLGAVKDMSYQGAAVEPLAATVYRATLTFMVLNIAAVES